MPLVPSALEEGKVLARRALRQGQWLQAESAHLAWLEEEQAGEAHFGLGVARWWLGQPRDALREWERSFAACRRSGDTAGAVLAAVYLCLGQRMSMGNEALAAGWLSRATAVAN